MDVLFEEDLMRKTQACYAAETLEEKSSALGEWMLNATIVQNVRTAEGMNQLLSQHFGREANLSQQQINGIVRKFSASLDARIIIEIST